MGTDNQIILIQDTREQNGYGPLFQTPYVTGTLSCGDYSILGLEELVAIERKSFSDLLGSLTSGRDRFETELKKARRYHRFFVVVECSASDLLVEDFGKLSRAHPRSIWGTVCIWSTRYVPFVFGNDRATAARLTEALLVGYAKEFLKKGDAMQKAARKAQGGVS
ncbi:MAG: ERCC4 domain-containing protein [Desulfomonilaceae bacterium]